jgi:hypothetical protein
LNFDAKVKIKGGLKGASKGYFPISLEKLEEDNKELYDIVLNGLLHQVPIESRKQI